MHSEGVNSTLGFFKLTKIPKVFGLLKMSVAYIVVHLAKL